jgi:hypothetical protein
MVQPCGWRARPNAAPDDATGQSVAPGGPGTQCGRAPLRAPSPHLAREGPTSKTRTATLALASSTITSAACRPAINPGSDGDSPGKQSPYQPHDRRAPGDFSHAFDAEFFGRMRSQFFPPGKAVVAALPNPAATLLRRVALHPLSDPPPLMSLPPAWNCDSFPAGARSSPQRPHAAARRSPLRFSLTAAPRAARTKRLRLYNAARSESAFCMGGARWRRTPQRSGRAS